MTHSSCVCSIWLTGPCVLRQGLRHPFPKGGEPASLRVDQRFWEPSSTHTTIVNYGLNGGPDAFAWITFTIQTSQPGFVSRRSIATALSGFSEGEPLSLHRWSVSFSVDVDQAWVSSQVCSLWTPVRDTYSSASFRRLKRIRDGFPSPSLMAL
jgi:hypothetical protein